MFTAGFLSERVTVYVPSISTSAYSAEGKVVYDDEDAHVMWANVTYQKGSRSIHEGAVLLGNLILVRCREHDYLTDRCQLEWQGVRYKIIEFNHTRHERTMQLKCEKVTNE